MTKLLKEEYKVDTEKLLIAAEKIGKIAEAEAVEADKNATVSQNVIDAIKESGIHKLFIPEKYGGKTIDLISYAKVIRKIAYYSPSAAWLSSFFSIHNTWVAHLPLKGREEIFNDGGLIADVLAPVGKVENDGDDYLLSGQWNFTSGVNFSDWIGLGALVPHAGRKGMEHKLFAVHKKDLEIVENWDTLGLRGSGSNGVKLDRVKVPAHRVLSLSQLAESAGKPLYDDVDHTELVYQLPWHTFFYVGFPNIALGAIERLLAEFQERTENRLRVYEDGRKENESPRSQRLLADLKTKKMAAEGLADRYLSLLEEYQNDHTGELTNEGPEQFFAIRAEVAQIAMDIAVKVLHTAGGNAVYKGDPVELFTRDILTFSSHFTSLHEDALEAYGKRIFGFANLPKF